MGAFKKEELDAFFEELNKEWKGKPDYEKLVRDAHLGIALHDSGRSFADQVDSRVATLIDKHKPKE